MIPLTDTTTYTRIDSPFGPLLAARSGDGLTRLDTPRGTTPPRCAERDDDAFDDLRAQLEAYFAGDLREFDLPLAPRGTPFQRRVWERLLRVPYGTTTTYAAIARSLRAPTACRAVGAANGRNPIAIVIPCHRVIGSDGGMRGYAGGLDMKRRLLALEARG